MDVQPPQNKPGFPGLAYWTALSPDHEAFIFRKFDRLVARNLLHLESKHGYLDWKLEEADEKAVRSSDNENLRSIRVWEAFEENARDPNRPEHARMKIAEEIKETLKEYQDALLRQSQIATLSAPRQRTLDVVHEHFYGNLYGFLVNGKGQPALGGLAENRLCKENEGDLVALRKPAETDLLSRFLQDNWIFKTTSVTDEIEHIQESHVLWATRIISTIIAAILLLGAVILLRLVKNDNAQLGLIAVFVALFAVSVSVLTNARRAEVFASTAAYAAVFLRCYNAFKLRGFLYMSTTR